MKGVAPFHTPWCCSYRKGALVSPATTVANFTLLFTLKWKGDCWIYAFLKGIKLFVKWKVLCWIWTLVAVLIASDDSNYTTIPVTLLTFSFINKQMQNLLGFFKGLIPWLRRNFFLFSCDIKNKLELFCKDLFFFRSFFYLFTESVLSQYLNIFSIFVKTKKPKKKNKKQIKINK